MIEIIGCKPRRGLTGALAAVLLLWASPPAGAAEPILGSDLAPQTQLRSGLDQGFVTRGTPRTGPTPRARCNNSSRQEGGLQGRVPPAADDGFTCNLKVLGREGETGGFKVERYIDDAGHECAFYDTALVFPTNAPYAATSAPGTAVLDMTDPAMPVRTATLSTPAMLSPHESLLVNRKRGLLAAVAGNPTTLPGIVDLYDIKADCRTPQLLSSLPVGFLGHESGFSPDGNTFWATSQFSGTIAAIDVTDPRVPSTLWIGRFSSHGLSLSADGNRAYLSALLGGLTILDVSEIQARKANPQVRVVSKLTWPELSIPQNSEPVIIKGKPHLIETDEFSTGNQGGPIPASNGDFVGAARIIDISNEMAPKVVSNLRLAVHQPENRATVAGDPGAFSPGQGYAAHYCGVPRMRDPKIVACSMIASGLRVFDVRDPANPREIAYFVAPARVSTVTPDGANYAMSRPAFDIRSREIWYADGGSGFYSLKVAKRAWPFGRPPPCRARQAFTIRLPERLRSARVKLDGRRVAVRRSRGRLRVRVDLRKAAGSRHALRIAGRARNGQRVFLVRKYRTCKRA
ncbi:MAG: hypothetical protein WKF94_13880 [Solirubrobacteraceae bacterium]